MISATALRELNCGNIEINFYGDRDNLEVSVKQSVPFQWEKSTYYQTISHRFPVKDFSEIEPEIIKRLTAFQQMVAEVKNENP